MPRFDSEAKTLTSTPSKIEPDAAFKAQESLTEQLSSSSDPHVRLIAHMSSRQLEMSMRLSDLVRSLDARDQKFDQALSDINRKLGDLTTADEGMSGRLDDLESEEGHLNGSQHPG